MQNKNIFEVIKVSKPPKSVFDLSHDVKLTGKMGDLIPVMAMDVVPGDKVRISNEALVRFMPMLAPVMHRFDVTFHNFFVPNRLLWENWEDYITNTQTGGMLPAHPTLQIKVDPVTGLVPPLADYMGVPSPMNSDQLETNREVNALPFAAYQMIYNEWYRDENLVPEVNYQLGDGTNIINETELLTLRKRAFEHDYFTSALPFVQKGPAVQLPVQGIIELDANASDETTFRRVSDGGINNGGVSVAGLGTTQVLNENVAYDPNGTLVMNGATTTINDLRRANALQRFLEKLARGGSRLTEMIRIMFGVTPQDARLDRPEYISGNKSPVVVSEVLNTSGGALPQGNMAGHAASYINGKDGSYFCQEHGYIITVLNVQPRTAYQQGIAKHLLRYTDPTEYYFPDFANIGEQPIRNEEVYAWTGDPTGTFGYTPRYAEYKFMNSRVCGQMQTTLDYWHAGRIFANAPALNQAFIEAIPVDRIFAVTDPAEDKLVIQVYNTVKAVRPMPFYGTPSF